MTSILSECSENINADEGVAFTSINSITNYKESKIHQMHFKKPFSRTNYIKPKSVIVSNPKSNYIQMRRRRAGYGGRIDPK
jgi:hypothetical protein